MKPELTSWLNNSIFSKLSLGINFLLSKIGLKIIKIVTFNALVEKYKKLLKEASPSLIAWEARSEILDLTVLEESNSQFNQEFFVLSILNFKTRGYFVEFGACNGKDFSNTFILENKYNWNGICAEPNRSYHSNLIKNRKCELDFRCVFSRSGEMIEFCETKISELSTIANFKKSDFNRIDRNPIKSYLVETVTLIDLLNEHNAPSLIDYISIDTEGSEFEILKNFDFDKYTVKVWTIEHNYTSNRKKIFELMVNNGYVRVLSSVSEVDDWYIHKSLIQPLKN